ncbi:MAG: SDR family oxidoreductase [Firmicutes bacterium]|jgi:NAD(P)-dependent dehydrogenase (short-subunit alcohol dehydrogenase family)|nr:SDR family oxidoreductase [Bacillota bacterium]
MKETVLITGAGRGIGLALTKEFLAAGYRVFAGVRKTYHLLEKEKEQYPADLILVPLDVTDMASVRAAAAQVSAATPALEILVNNAGVYLGDKTRPLEELDLEDNHLQQTMEVNAFGPLRVVQQFLPLLAAGEKKIIINISSEAGSIGDCWRKQEYAYAMSKAALNMQTRILHNYLSPRGFKVRALHPGWVRTDMGGKEADLDPATSAAGIFNLIQKVAAGEQVTKEDGEGIYLDYQGNILRW